MIEPSLVSDSTMKVVHHLVNWSVATHQFNEAANAYHLMPLGDSVILDSLPNTWGSGVRAQGWSLLVLEAAVAWAAWHRARGAVETLGKVRHLSYALNMK